MRATAIALRPFVCVAREVGGSSDFQPCHKLRERILAANIAGEYDAGHTGMKRLVAEQPCGNARRSLPGRPCASHIQGFSGDSVGCRAALDDDAARLCLNAGDCLCQRLRYLMTYG